MGQTVSVRGIFIVARVICLGHSRTGTVAIINSRAVKLRLDAGLV